MESQWRARTSKSYPQEKTMKKRRDLKFKDIVFPPGARLQQLGPYWPHPTSTRARKPADSSPQVSDNRHKRSGAAGRNPAYT